MRHCSSGLHSCNVSLKDTKRKRNRTERFEEGVQKQSATRSHITSYFRWRGSIDHLSVWYARGYTTNALEMLRNHGYSISCRASFSFTKLEIWKNLRWNKDSGSYIGKQRMCWNCSCWNKLLYGGQVGMCRVMTNQLGKVRKTGCQNLENVCFDLKKTNFACFKQCCRDLIFLWEQLVYSVTEQIRRGEETFTWKPCTAPSEAKEGTGRQRGRRQGVWFYYVTALFCLSGGPPAKLCGRCWPAEGFKPFHNSPAVLRASNCCLNQGDLSSCP